MSEPYQLFSPWPEQALAFTTAIQRFARLVDRARTGMASHFQLTVPGWRMLQLIEQSGNRATLTQLARRLKVTRPSARETAGRLIDVGYLSMERSLVDRRLQLLTVTEAGLECLSELEAGVQVLLLEMTNDIPAHPSRTLRGFWTGWRGAFANARPFFDVRRGVEPPGKLSRCRRSAFAGWSSH